jgi:predicted anti-sigma-YlaC factor YlaD
MDMTHQEAQRLIQNDSDRALAAAQRKMLESHLATCNECREYAHSVRKMESILRPLLQRQWNEDPIPLSIGLLTSKSNQKAPYGALLATRIAAVSVMFIVFMVSTWQFMISRPRIDSPILASVPAIPVPSTSTRMTSTQAGLNNCHEISYRAHQDDTLASIALQFSITEEEIMASNHLGSETLVAGMELMILICETTPTSTTNTLTTTFTPVLSPITSTPGG